MSKPKYKRGKQLKVGDTIKAWYGRDTITALRPYNGSLAYLWVKDGGAQLADFALNRVGMTIGALDVFEIF